MLNPGDWIALGSVSIVSLGLALAYLRRPALLPASRVDELRQMLGDCRGECAELRAKVVTLNDTIHRLNSRLDDLTTDLETAQRNLRRVQRKFERDEGES